jgi:hypothetical protein
MIGTSWMRNQSVLDALLVEEMRKRGMEKITRYEKITWYDRVIPERQAAQKRRADADRFSLVAHRDCRLRVFA